MSQAQSYVISYLGLRKAIGTIGVLFPFILIFGNMIATQQFSVEESISDYYHTGMRDIFVACLCAMGVFLFSYRGHERKDDIAGDLAAIFAIGVALVPVTPRGSVDSFDIILGYLHVLLALSYFIILIYFCLVLFKKSAPNVTPTPQKLLRNRVYTLCGYAIIVSIVLMAIAFVLVRTQPALREIKPILWLEVVAICAFGISWFVKGEGMIKDL